MSSWIFQVKPLLSLDNAEARMRVLSLYKAWWRYIPTMVERYELPVTTETCRKQLRRKFEANSHLRDIRVIDMTVVKVTPDAMPFGKLRTWNLRIQISSFVYKIKQYLKYVSILNGMTQDEWENSYHKQS